MSMLMDLTATQLADALDDMESYPHNTGGLSMLDEATLAYGWKYESTGPAQRAFADARQAHMRSYRTDAEGYSGEAWAKAMTAAHALARALRELGPVLIPRCKHQMGWGTCNTVLSDDGTCRHAGEHRD